MTPVTSPVSFLSAVFIIRGVFCVLGATNFLILTLDFNYQFTCTYIALCFVPRITFHNNLVLNVFCLITACFLSV